MSGSESGNGQSGQSGTDIAAGLILAAISCFAIFWLIPANVSTVSGNHDVSPAFFPYLCAYSVLGLSSAMVATRVWKHQPSLRGVVDAGSHLLETGVWLLAAAAIVACIGKFGFLITSIVVVGGAAWASRHPNKLSILLLAVAFPVVIDRLVPLIFSVEMP